MRQAQFRNLVLVTAACTIIGASSSAATVSTTLTPVSSRAEAPAFRLADASLKTEKLTDYRGKVILLNFWATDCGGCRLEIPWLVDIDTHLKNQNFALIGVSLDIPYEDLKGPAEAWTKVKPFVETHQVFYPILMGDDEVARYYDTRALPVTYLIDSSGRIAAKYVGLIDQQNVETNIKALLAEHR